MFKVDQTVVTPAHLQQQNISRTGNFIELLQIIGFQQLTNKSVEELFLGCVMPQEKTSRAK